MGYLAPDYDKVDFGLEPDYTAPLYNAVNFDIEPIGGSNIEIPVPFALSTSVTAFTESFQEVEAGFFLDAEITGRSGPIIDPVVEFALSTDVEMFNESYQEVSTDFALDTIVDIGIKSWVDTSVEFALSTEVEVKSSKDIKVNGTFALATELEVSEKGEPLLVNGLFALSTRVTAKTDRNYITASFVLSGTVDSVMTYGQTIEAGFALSGNITSQKEGSGIEVNGNLALGTVVAMVNSSSDCSIESYNDGRWA